MMDDIDIQTYMDAWPWLIVAALVVLLIMFIRAAARATEVDWGVGWMNWYDGYNRLYCRNFHRMQGERIELPEQGPAILVANHSSGLDPMLLFAASRRKLRFLIAKEQYQRFGFEWFFRAIGCIPVDRSGRPEQAFREALKMLKAGEVIAVFPHGTMHQDHEPRRRLKPGAVRLAQLADCPIYPVRIEGIRGHGGVFKPLFLRAHARLYNRPRLDCSDLSADECLQRLEELLQPQAQRQQSRDMPREVQRSS